jgi:Do/DeqQ family serine protease
MQPRESYRAAKTLILAGSLLVIGIVVGFVLAGSGGNGSPAAAAKESPKAVSALESPFTAVAAKALPAVVTIEVKRTAKAGDGSPQFNFEGPYGDFFKRFFPENPHGRGDIKIPSSGSGFIIDHDGRILTNNHVVRDASDISVTLSDHRKFKAKVVGSDPSTDVAVIQIPGSRDLPLLPLGDSDEVRIGDWAIAIGNALGELDGTLTVGVVSAKGRTDLSIVGGAPAYQNFIQTDASINFGNSGGPLLNIRGEAIGINTAINPSGQGIGFAIPVNLAKHIADQLIASGKVVRGFLGIVPQELTPDLAEGLGVKDTKGILVGNVSNGQPADAAGIRTKDIITEFDGKPVEDVQKFRLLVADTPAKKKVPVRLLREGRPQTLYVTLSERPDEQALAQQQRTPAERLGITVEPVTGDFAQQNDIREKTGVVVTDVTEGSPADDAGLQRGDVIKEVNDAPVKEISDYNAAVDRAKSKSPSKPIVLLVKRGDITQFVAIDPEG